MHFIPEKKKKKKKNAMARGGFYYMSLENKFDVVQLIHVNWCMYKQCKHVPLWPIGYCHFGAWRMLQGLEVYAGICLFRTCLT